MNTKQWISKHLSDFYVKEAKRLNYRSRAAFKLIEMNKRFQFLKNGKKILDLGCAPGGWLQIIKQISKNSKIIGIDLLPVNPFDGITIFEGDFMLDENQKKITDIFNGKIDVVLSDISSSMTGTKDLDRANMREIADNIIIFAERNLNKGGSLLFKYFKYDEGELKKILKKMFKNVICVKPKVSRSESSEIYIFASDFTDIESLSDIKNNNETK